MIGFVTGFVLGGLLGLAVVVGAVYIWSKIVNFF
ncbi:Uncharacterised protein [Mycobacteroides abscessus subsp. massiliense]|nr:Uncharacterised protein [Mycobacteroides abscessus subsp. abscessus]SKM67294.1 Uncharacterised protein [Mycobacteroides abscessus subsp. massiliense]SKN33762.1 Uncharacterised protein [Mycobacteroides abscessus subsp. massiliense]SKP15639.1 Uncharacterised protein [Mycobacteroides abscessus subsp. massiliense]SKP58270.1 Uncharacterised protein [Mycobacteroides abscessus subsp. massiliense]